MDMPNISSSEIALALTLLREARTGSLATLDSKGAPFASYVTLAPGVDNSPVLLLSRLAAHTRNLQRDPRASLLLVCDPSRDSESMAAQRLTLTGRVAGDDNPAARRLFLANHPDASRYADFGDFGIYRFAVEAGHLVAGFGRIASLAAADLIGQVSRP